MPSYTPTTWVNGSTAVNATRMNNLEAGVTQAVTAAETITGYKGALPVPAQPYVVLEVCVGDGITVGSTVADGYLATPHDQPWTTTRQGRTSAYAQGSTTSTTDAVGLNKLFLWDLQGAATIDRFGGRLVLGVQRNSTGSATLTSVDVQLVKVSSTGTETVLATATVAVGQTASDNNIKLVQATFDKDPVSPVTLSATDRLGVRIKITGLTSTGSSAANFFLNTDDREISGSNFVSVGRGGNRSRVAVRFA